MLGVINVMIKLFFKKAYLYRLYMAWLGLLLALIFGDSIYIKIYGLFVFVLLFIGFMNMVVKHKLDD